MTRTALAGVAIMLETSVLIGLIVPGDTVVLIAGTGVTTLLQGVALVIVVVIGSLLGESLGYVLGRFLGPRIRDTWLGRKIGEKNWQRSERYLQRRGGPAIFLSRFLPVLHSLVPLTVGMARLSYRRFLIWTVPACVVWSVIYVSVASLAAGSFRELSQHAHWAGYVFVGVIAFFFLAAFLIKKFLWKREQRHMEEPQDVAD